MGAIVKRADAQRTRPAGVARNDQAGQPPGWVTVTCVFERHGLCEGGQYCRTGYWHTCRCDCHANVWNR